MQYKQLNLAFKPTNYEIICEAYRKAMAKEKGEVPTLNEWARGKLLNYSKRINRKQKYLKDGGK